MSAVGAIILAILTPKEGRLNEVIELYQPLIQSVKAIEPECLSFRIHLEIEEKTGEQQVFLLEQLTNYEAVKFHRSNEVLDDLVKALDQTEVLKRPVYLKVIKPVAGFSTF